MCDKRDRPINRVFCVLSWLTLMFSGLLQKDLLKGSWSLADCFFKKNYCHACHTGFPSPVLLRKFTNNSLGREKFFFLCSSIKTLFCCSINTSWVQLDWQTHPKASLLILRRFFCRVDEFLSAGQGTKLEKKPWKVLLYQWLFWKGANWNDACSKAIFLKLQLREI